MKTTANLLKMESYAAAKDEFVRSEMMSLSQDQVMRLSLLMNIHGAIRLRFSNPENVYGFMSMMNQNPASEVKSRSMSPREGKFSKCRVFISV